MSIKKHLNDAEKAVNGLESGARRRLLQSYKKALDDVRAELARVYAKYEVAGKLTYGEMSKYNRLDALFDSISGEIKNLTGETQKEIRKLAGNVYQESFYRTAFALEAEAKVRLSFGILKPEAIQASVQNPFSGLTLNERLAKHRVDVITRAREQVTQGMIRGESYADVAKRLKGVFEGDAAKSLRVASTETHRNYMQGSLDAEENAGERGLETGKVWVATLDGVTRDSHADMDGQEADADGNFTLVSGPNKGAQAQAPGLFGIAAEDIYCRCRYIIVIKGFEPELRRVRGEGVVEYKTYGQWAADHGIAA